MISAQNARWLATGEGREAAKGVAGDPQYALQEVESLRARGCSPDQAAAALDCAQARRRHHLRLGRDDWLLTSQGAEQATRPPVAAMRAERFGGQDTIVDVTCGLGFDLAALSKAAPNTLGLDADPGLAVLAAANVGAADIACASLGSIRVPPKSAVFVDPMRRSARGRIRDPDKWSPTLADVLQLPNPSLAVKVAPGIDHQRVPPGHELEVVSINGDVVEAAIYRGPLRIDTAHRRATLLRSDASDPKRWSQHSLTDRDLPTTNVAARSVRTGQFLYEPDKAVIRAGLVAAVAPITDSQFLDARVAYLCGDHLRPTPFATVFRVIDAFGFSLKALRKRVREVDASSVAIKTRANAIDPAQLRPQLTINGTGEELTVFVTRIGDKPWVILARRI